MFERLSRKEILRKKTEAERFGVDDKTIQRDIDDLRMYLAEPESGQRFSDIKYYKKHNGYMLVGKSEIWLSNEHILATARVLMESRAFSKFEMMELLNRLVLQSHPFEAKMIKEIICNELHHYVAVQHGKPLLQSIWELSQAVREHRLINISYKRTDQEVVERLIKPQSVIFAEYYFYLISYICDQDPEMPIPYRLDRIIDYHITGERFTSDYARRFEEGEFRKRVQFMHPGDIIKIQLKYWGRSEEAILDRLPTARVVKREGDFVYIEAEVFGHGIKIWLLSQAQYLEVLSPPEFRAEMENTIVNMLKIYRGPDLR